MTDATGTTESTTESTTEGRAGTESATVELERLLAEVLEVNGVSDLFPLKPGPVNPADWRGTSPNRAPVAVVLAHALGLSIPAQPIQADDLAEVIRHNNEHSEIYSDEHYEAGTEAVEAAAAAISRSLDCGPFATLLGLLAGPQGAATSEGVAVSDVEEVISAMTTRELVQAIALTSRLGCVMGAMTTFLAAGVTQRGPIEGMVLNAIAQSERAFDGPFARLFKSAARRWAVATQADDDERGGEALTIEDITAMFRQMGAQVVAVGGGERPIVADPTIPIS